jgi:hypothetical protein
MRCNFRLEKAVKIKMGKVALYTNLIIAPKKNAKKKSF